MGASPAPSHLDAFVVAQVLGLLDGHLDYRVLLTHSLKMARP